MKLFCRGLLLGVAFFPAAMAGADVTVIVGGTIHTMSETGTLQDATVVIEDGQISAVRRGRYVPEGATVIDADGKVVTPGLFAARTQLGLVEVSAVAGTVDSGQQGERFTAAFDVADSFNPESSLIAINRVAGVTRAVIVPSPAWGGDQAPAVFSGSAAVVHLGGNDDYLAVRKAAVVAHIGETGGYLAGGSRSAALMSLTEALDDAIDYKAHRDAYDAGARRPYSISKADLEALQSVISGETPLMLSAHRASDIRVAIDLADRFGLRLILVGGAEAWKLADRLAASNTPVIISPLSNLPSGFDQLAASLSNARVLSEASVRVLIADGSSHNVRNLTQLAGNAVAHGLPWQDGLAAITSAPAEVLGLGDKFGKLAAGMVADVVVWDGDPLEVTSHPVAVFVEGERVANESRQSLLRDRYQSLDDTRPPAYRNR
ncbi:MAG: amidohydrolase family protein [Pseudomonadota bacterium]